jgi:aminoglycoside 2'-N-acetyltransferase I
MKRKNANSILKVNSQMTQVLVYPQVNCPRDVRTQIVQLLRAEWPNTFRKDELGWPTESSELSPLSIVIIANGRVISHAAVLRKTIKHCGTNYLAFGLSCVVTQRSSRGKGFGRRIIEYATKYMKQENADLGVFTCDSNLEPFYTLKGWEIAPFSPLVGGTIEKPFPSDKLGKVTIVQLFSARAKEDRTRILSRPIVIGLGEGKLW